MSWGWMPPQTGNAVTNVGRMLDDKEPSGLTGPRTIRLQLPSPYNLSGSTFTGVKPGFPLGYEPDYTPHGVLPKDTRYDWACRGDWESSTGQTAAEPEGQDSTPPQQNAL